MSKTDLAALSRANAHYSDDIITQILNEPVRGKSYMWTSHQPFVVPVRVVNFEDPKTTTPNSSASVQVGSLLLDGVRDEVYEEFHDPRQGAIHAKFKAVEKDNPGMDLKEKTKKLFKMITDDEREFLKSRGSLQEGPSGDIFAVSFRYYRSLQGMR